MVWSEKECLRSYLRTEVASIDHDTFFLVIVFELLLILYVYKVT